MIVIIGNIASGKSTVARLLADRMEGYHHVCSDNFRDEKPDKYFEVDNRIFEEEIAQETRQAIQNNRLIIYESTGSSRFFKDIFYELVQSNAEIFTVRLTCRPEICMLRYKKRIESGKGHLVPMYNNSKTAEELIHQHDKKSAWVKAHISVDSEKTDPEKIASFIYNSHPDNHPERVLEVLHKEFDYKKALTWVNANVKGKNFLKQVLAGGEDDYNRLKLKTLINEEYELLQQKKTKKPLISPKPYSPVYVPNKRSNFDREELEDIVREMSDDLYQEIEDIREKLESPVSEKYRVQDEDDLDEKWKPIFKEANHFFTLLEFEPDEEKRKEIAFHVLDLMDEVQKVWDAKDFKKKFGQVPNFDSKGMDQLSVEQMATRIRTLRTYISKANKGKLNKDRIPDWEAEMKELEMKIRN